MKGERLPWHRNMCGVKGLGISLSCWAEINQPGWGDKDQQHVLASRIWWDPDISTGSEPETVLGLPKPWPLGAEQEGWVRKNHHSVCVGLSPPFTINQDLKVTYSAWIFPSGLSLPRGKGPLVSSSQPYISRLSHSDQHIVGTLREWKKLASFGKGRSSISSLLPSGGHQVLHASRCSGNSSFKSH